MLRTFWNLARVESGFDVRCQLETLLQQLSLEGIATLVVETDEAAARAVLEKQQAVVFTHRRPEETRAARLPVAARPLCEVAARSR